MNWDEGKKHVLFAANPSRRVKNFALAESAFRKLRLTNAELHVLQKVSPDKIPTLMNASDIVLLTSLWEGSPNVIKEAMACNVKIISTDVGDVPELIGSTKGCYVCDHNPRSVSSALKKALNDPERTDGRSAIEPFDAKKISQKIIEIYKESIPK